MSMLTPPGMGGKYKITGNAYPRMRRPRGRRRLVVALAALTATGVLGWGTLELFGVFTGEHQAGAAQKLGCGSNGSSAKGSGTNGTNGKGNGNGNGDQGSKGSRQAGKAAGVSGQTLPDTGAITVNVYNATPRTGLAKRAADELKKRGFKIGKVDNAPAEYDKKVTESALLVGSPKAKPAFSVLGAHLAGTRSSEDEKRKDTTVDLVIGRAFKDFDPPQTAAKTLTALAKPSPTASGRDC